MVESAGGVTRGKGGAQLPGHRITLGAVKYCGGRRMIVEAQKVPTVSQALSSIQCICFRKTSGSNMGAPNLLLAPGAIYPRYAPISQKISSVNKLIHSHSCCKTRMQTNCELKNCTGNSPETGFSFSFWRFEKS